MNRVKKKLFIFLINLIFIILPSFIFPEEYLSPPQIVFYIYRDVSQELYPDCWVGSGEGDSILQKDNRCYTTYPNKGPKYSGTDALIFDWEHRWGWAVFSIARDWWIPIDISDYIKNNGYLQFMVKGEKGDEDMMVNLGIGGNRSTPHVKISDYLENNITTNWQKVMIPLTDFNHDFSENAFKVQTISFNIPWRQGKYRIYIDDLGFIHTYGEEFQKVKIPFEPDNYTELSFNIQKRIVKPGGIIVDKWKTAETLDLSFEILNDLGIKYIKLDFPWVNIEPKQGEYIFEDYLPIINKCQEYNIEILGCIKDTPFWAKNPNRQNNFRKYPPEKLIHLANYVYHLAIRYKESISYWQIWENPDDYMSAQDYYDIMKYSYTAAKKGNPSARILCQVNDIEFLYKLPDFKYCDIIGLDIDYIEKDYPLNKNLNKLYKKKNIDKPIWITSLGKINLQNNNLSSCEKAKWIEKIYPMLLSHKYIQNIF